ncbi:MAG TPA: HAD family hydrolase, partial [Nitrosopumilaceae archaeon]|nr:HAD family hydrolase [Nitrosopumilaceae archaeon]
FQGILSILVSRRIISKHRMTLKDFNIDKTWTLFLDRDGVINKRLENDYVKHPIDFEFLPGVLSSLKKLKDIFGKIVVVTNQQGIGKGLYRVEDLELIHKNMLYEVNYFGGKIDKIYFSPYLSSENHPSRKPGIGMAMEAKNDFPEIDLSKSVIVGDSLSDMEFGRNAGMKTVFIASNNTLVKYPQLFDIQFESLEFFTDSL